MSLLMGAVRRQSVSMTRGYGPWPGDSPVCSATRCPSCLSQCRQGGSFFTPQGFHESGKVGITAAGQGTERASCGDRLTAFQEREASRIELQVQPGAVRQQTGN